MNNCFSEVNTEIVQLYIVLQFSACKGISFFSNIMRKDNAVGSGLIYIYLASLPLI